MDNVPASHVDLAVVGSGLAGLTTALALAQQVTTKTVAMIGPMNTGSDGRTTALLMPSIAILERFGIWGELKEEAAELSTMRLIDGSNRLLRAPVTDFRASELDLEAFGYNVPNAKLGPLLERHLANCPNVQRIDARITSAECENDGVSMKLSNGNLVQAGFVAAADGRHSLLRDTARIETRQWSYP